MKTLTDDSREQISYVSKTQRITPTTGKVVT